MAATTTPELATDRLRLEALRVDHTIEMETVLGDPSLYVFTGGGPPERHELEARYRRQTAGSASPHEQWHNWVVRRTDTGEAAGFLQATDVDDEGEEVWLASPP